MHLGLQVGLPARRRRWQGGDADPLPDQFAQITTSDTLFFSDQDTLSAGSSATVTVNIINGNGA